MYRFKMIYSYRTTHRFVWFYLYNKYFRGSIYGVRNMQGVSAHLEYLNNNKSKERKVNCTFCIDGICFNNISTKYGEKCRNKSSCLYSIPMGKNKGVSNSRKKNSRDISKGKKSNNIGKEVKVDKVTEVISIYFRNKIETKTKVNDKYFKVIAIYNKEKDEFIEEVFCKLLGKEISIRVRLKLRSIIEIADDKVKFTIKIDDIINSLKMDGNNRAASYIKQIISENIIRKVDIKDNIDIENKIEGIVKYIVLRAYDKAIKENKSNKVKIKK